MAEEKRYKQEIVPFLVLGFRDLLQNRSPAKLSEPLGLFRSEGNPKAGLRGEFDDMFEYAALSDCFFRTAETSRAINRKHSTGLFTDVVPPWDVDFTGWGVSPD